MHPILKPLLVSGMCFAPIAGNANVNVKFQESAPKDRFVITNTGECTLDNIQLTVDLSNSNGKLIFDTTAAGEGVEVFQPFESRSESLQLSDQSSVLDGQRALTVNIDQLEPVASVSFTIDVDDTIPQGELGMIRVAGSEMSGAVVSISVDGSENASAVFDTKSTAYINLTVCP